MKENRLADRRGGHLDPNLLNISFWDICYLGLGIMKKAKKGRALPSRFAIAKVTREGRKKGPSQFLFERLSSVMQVPVIPWEERGEL